MAYLLYVLCVWKLFIRLDPTLYNVVCFGLGSHNFKTCFTMKGPWLTFVSHLAHTLPCNVGLGTFECCPQRLAYNHPFLVCEVSCEPNTLSPIRTSVESVDLHRFSKHHLLPGRLVWPAPLARGALQSSPSCSIQNGLHSFNWSTSTPSLEGL